MSAIALAVADSSAVGLVSFLFSIRSGSTELASYIVGTAGHYPLKPYVLSESTLTRLGLLLRQFHDATISFSLPEKVVWHNAINGKREVICHGDAGPYNIAENGLAER
jgi:hypothetical protein